MMIIVVREWWICLIERIALIRVVVWFAHSLSSKLWIVELDDEDLCFDLFGIHIPTMFSVPVNRHLLGIVFWYL